MKNKRLLLAGDTLTLLFLMGGFLGCFLPVNRFFVEGWELLLWTAALGAGSAALHTWRHGSWAALGLLTAEGLLVRLGWEGLGFAGWLRGGTLQDASLEFFLLSLALALLLGWVVVRARRWYLAALAVLTPLLPAIVGGVLPDWRSLMAMTAGWGAMLLTALFSRRDSAALGRSVLVSIAGMGTLLLALSAALPQEGYDRPQWATNARNDLLASMAAVLSGGWELEAPDFLDGYLGDSLGVTGFGGLAVGAPSSAVVWRDGGASVNLLTAGPRRYSGRALMEVEGAQSGVNYLWGGAAANYTGSSWEDVDRAACDALREELSVRLELGGSAEPLLFPAMASSSPAEVMTIRHLKRGGTTAHLPYRFSAFLTPGVELEGFLSMGRNVRGESRGVREKGLQEYQAAYIPGSPAADFVPLEGDAAMAEELYREFVYQNYLDVPEEARRALEPLMDTNNIDILLFLIFQGQFGTFQNDQWDLSVSVARAVASALSTAARYDQSTPAMERGEDFVAQFIEEGRGYCVHFATAGAMLLRMQGIPARYVSGYSFTADDTGKAQVLDSDAHAWVEIYLDGYGWYPVEMTPGAGGGPDGPAPDLEETDSPEDPEEPDEPASLEEPDEPDIPEAPEKLESPEEESVEMPTLPGEETEGPGGSEAVRKPLDLSWVKPLVLAALIAAAPFALFQAGAALRRRSRERPDCNRSAIAAYLRCRRLRLWGGAEDEALTELAQKAKFSQHTLSPEERDAAWAFLDAARASLEEKLPWWKRWVFRCLRPLF